MIARPAGGVIGGLMGGRGGRSASGGSRSAGSPSGGIGQPVSSDIASSGQPNQPEAEEPSVNAPKPQQMQQPVQQEEPEIERVADDLQKQPPPQPQQEKQRPLTSGLLDDPTPSKPAEKTPGTTIMGSPQVANQTESPEPTSLQAGSVFPSTPSGPGSDMRYTVTDKPPRTFFEAPDGNPTRQVSTENDVSHSSPGYATQQPSIPAGPMFSYMRR